VIPEKYDPAFRNCIHRTDNSWYRFAAEMVHIVHHVSNKNSICEMLGIAAFCYAKCKLVISLIQAWL